MDYVYPALALVCGVLLLWGGNTLINMHHDRRLRRL